MSQDQLSGLLALKAVAQTLNFTAAAETLGVSPSAVSQAIKQLEKRLRVALLSRTTRSTSLTEAGERFLTQAAPALDQLLSVERVSGLIIGRVECGLVIVEEYQRAFFGHRSPAICGGRRDRP